VQIPANARFPAKVRISPPIGECATLGEILQSRQPSWSHRGPRGVWSHRWSHPGSANGDRPTAATRLRAGTSLRVVREPLRPFFTPRTLAEYLSLSERTVRQMLIDGRIASYRVEGSRRVDPTDVEDCLQSHRQQAR